MSMWVPVGYDPVEYRIAQERMWELRSRQDDLQKIISIADGRLKQTIDERRALLRDFPTLQLGVRE